MFRVKYLSVCRCVSVCGSGFQPTTILRYEYFWVFLLFFLFFFFPYELLNIKFFFFSSVFVLYFLVVVFFFFSIYFIFPICSDKLWLRGALVFLVFLLRNFSLSPFSSLLSVATDSIVWFNNFFLVQYVIW